VVADQKERIWPSTSTKKKFVLILVLPESSQKVGVHAKRMMNVAWDIMDCMVKRKVFIRLDIERRYYLVWDNNQQQFMKVFITDFDKV
jgi:hypothetical protein